MLIGTAARRLRVQPVGRRPARSRTVLYPPARRSVTDAAARVEIGFQHDIDRVCARQRGQRYVGCASASKSAGAREAVTQLHRQHAVETERTQSVAQMTCRHCTSPRDGRDRRDRSRSVSLRCAAR
jgi:hypothetical protein